MQLPRKISPVGISNFELFFVILRNCDFCSCFLTSPVNNNNNNEEKLIH